MDFDVQPTAEVGTLESEDHYFNKLSMSVVSQQQVPTEEEDAISSPSDVQTKRLNLQDSSIATLSPSIGRMFPNLEDLDVSYTYDLSHLPEQIGNLAKLTKLNLKHSEIKYLPSSIGRLKALRDLNLACTSKLSLLPNEIGELVNLQSLDLHFSSIESLPISIGRLTNLDLLDLSGTRQLFDLPKTIGNLIGLKTLVLRKAAVRSVPACIGNLQKLQSLDISYTKGFSVLPDTIGDLHRLRKLNLEHSAITGLPPSIGKLKDHQLRDLNLSSTEISSLPDDIGKFFGLKLNLQHCQFASTAQASGFAMEHWKIRELDISFTNIQDLSEAIGDNMATNLTKLVMHDTDVSSLPSSIGRLQILEHLDLSRTRNLVKLPTELGNLRSLMSLKLQASRIRELPPSIGKLGKLEHLDVSYATSLISLPEEIGNLINLNRLDLQQSSEIRCLPLSVVHLQNLRDLNVAGCTKLLFDLPSINGIGKIHSLTKLCLGRRHHRKHKMLSSHVTKHAKDIWYSLVCRKVQSKLRVKIVVENDATITDSITARSPNLWPFLLGNASRLVEKTSPKISNHDFRLCEPEAIHQLLQTDRESFLQIVPG